MHFLTQSIDVNSNTDEEIKFILIENHFLAASLQNADFALLLQYVILTFENSSCFLNTLIVDSPSRVSLKWDMIGDPLTLWSLESSLVAFE